MGAAVLGVKAPAGMEELTACSKDALGVLVWCLPTPVTARNCRGGAWGDVSAERSWCPTWLAECRQGVGREQGPGCVLAVTAWPRCSPAAASQRELIGTRDSFSHFPSPGSRQSLPGQAAQIRKGWQRQGICPPGKLGRQRKPTVSRGRGGCTRGMQARQPRALFLGNPSRPVPSALWGDPAPLGRPDSGSGAPAPPPSSAQTPALPDVHGLFSAFDTKPAQKFI